MAKITFVLPGYPVHAGGGYKIVYQYANYLVERGHKVNLVQMRPAHLRDDNSPWWRQGIRAMQYRFGRHARPTWFLLDPRVFVTNYRKQFVHGIPDSDVIVATAMETAHLVARASAQRKVVGVYFIQGYEDWLKGSAYVDETWRLSLRRIVIAPWLQEKANELDLNATLVPNAIDSHSFPRGAPIAERPLQILALVSEVPLKRTDLVAQVLHKIAEEMPEVLLRTFGVIQKPRILPASVVHLRDPTPAELRRLYQGSRVYICASDTEGSALPPAEALSTGGAVVSTDIGGVRAYADGIALFSPVGDADLLAQNALRLLRDEVLCEALASTGQERLRAYSLSDAAAAFEREILR